MSQTFCFFFSFLVVIFAFDGDPLNIDKGEPNMSFPVAHDPAPIYQNNTEWTRNTSLAANTGTLIGSVKTDGRTTQATTQAPKEVPRIRTSSEQPMNNQKNRGVNDNFQKFFDVVQSIDKLIYQDVMEMEERLANIKKAKVKEYHHDEKEPNLPFGVELRFTANDEEIDFKFEKVAHQVHSWAPFASTWLEGQKSVWNHTSDEIIDIFCDNQLKICAVMALKLVNGHLLRFVLLKFEAGNKTFLIEPPVQLLSTKADHNMRDVEPNMIIIKGTPHLMFEILPDDIPEDMQKITIFLIVTADYSLFKKYMDIQGNSIENARSKLLYDMITLGEETAKVMAEIPLNDSQFVVVVSGVKICEDQKECPFRESAQVNQSEINGEVLLENFKDFLEGEETLWPANTMFIVVTGDKIVVGGETQAGHTDSSTICRNKSVAVVTNQHNQRTAHSSAHQILQAIGVSKECEEEWISPSSTCTINALNEIVDGLVSSENNCLAGPNWYYKAEFVKPYDGKTPGQVHTLLEQCQLVFGPEASVCWPTDTASICQKLYCNTENECQTVTGLRAFEGTSCGDSSWCKTNECQKDSRAPSMFEGGPKNRTGPSDHCDSIRTQLEELQENLKSAKELAWIMAGVLLFLTAIAAVTVVLNVLLLKEKKLPRGHQA